MKISVPNTVLGILNLVIGVQSVGSGLFCHTEQPYNIDVALWSEIHWVG